MNPYARALALVLTVPLLALCAWMVRIVVVPVLIGGLFAIMLAPLHHRLSRRLQKRAWLSPGILTTGMLVVILTPTVIVGLLTFQQMRGIKTSRLAAGIQDFSGTGIRLLQRTFGWLSRFGVDMSTTSLKADFDDRVQRVMSTLGEWAASVLTAAPDLLVAVFLFVLGLYFGLRDGREFLLWLERVLPFPESEIRRLFQRMRETAYGVVIGQIFTGAVQASLALLFLIGLSVPGAFLWAILAFVLSFIPLFGTAPVPLGASLYLFSQGRPGAAAVMLGGLVLIGAADNVVRPLLAGDHTHPLVTLVAIFGGLATLGASGVFLGPVVTTLALWALEYYGQDKVRPADVA
jgi:predicted PurR-regulated permease PerM